MWWRGEDGLGVGMPKIVRLNNLMGTYNFSKEPLWGADIVITKDGRCAKDRHGTAGREATTEELEQAVVVEPNR